MALPVRLDEDGGAAPPRENGELAFSAPWESRLFGLTMTLVEAGRLDWGAFRQCLIARTAAWEERETGASWNYWQRWREALEDSLEAAGLVAVSEIDNLSRRLAARPHDHDHHLQEPMHDEPMHGWDRPGPPGQSGAAATKIDQARHRQTTDAGHDPPGVEVDPVVPPSTPGIKRMAREGVRESGRAS